MTQPDRPHPPVPPPSRPPGSPGPAEQVPEVAAESRTREPRSPSAAGPGRYASGDTPVDATPRGPGAHELVEVVALYGDRPQRITHLRPPPRRRVLLGAWSLLGIGVLLLLGGAGAFASQVVSAQRQQRHRAAVLAFIQERGLPPKYAPQVHTRPAVEAAGAGIFGMGLFLLLLGTIRLREGQSRPEFTIGEAPEALFHVRSDGLPSPNFRLVCWTESGPRVQFVTAMEGRVVRPGHAPQALADLARSGEAVPESQPGVYAWDLPSDARVFLAHGGARFEIRGVTQAEPLGAAPLRARAASWLGTPLSLALMGSASVLGAFLILMHTRPADADRLETEADLGAVPRRLRRLRSRAQAPRDPAPRPRARKTSAPRPVTPKTTRRTGARAATRDDRIRTPAAAHGSPHVGRGDPRQQGRNAGMLGVLQRSSGRLGSLFGRDVAVTQEQEDSLGALMAHQYGSDLLAGLGPGGRAGGGPGAGGVPLGSGWCGAFCSRGGGGVFDGPGTLPGGVPIGPGVPRRRARQPQVFLPPGQAEVRSIDPAAIRRVIRRNLTQVRYCYVSIGLADNPRLGGLLKVAFLIGPQGRVTRTQVARSTLGHPRTEACILAQIRTWRFPKVGNQSAYVVYPFRFRPAGAR